MAAEVCRGAGVCQGCGEVLRHADMTALEDAPRVLACGCSEARLCQDHARPVDSASRLRRLAIQRAAKPRAK